MKQYKEKEKSQKAVNAQATKSTKECAGEIYLLDTNTRRIHTRRHNQGKYLMLYKRIFAHI